MTEIIVDKDVQGQDVILVSDVDWNCSETFVNLNPHNKLTTSDSVGRLLFI